MTKGLQQTALMIFVICFAISHATAQTAPSASPQQVDALTALEAMNSDLATIASALAGQDPPVRLSPDQVRGNTTGTITATSWRLEFNGSVLGTNVSIVQVGSLQGNVRTWTETGFVGSDPLTGSGGMDGGNKWQASIAWGKFFKTLLTISAQVIGTSLAGSTGVVGVAVGIAAEMASQLYLGDAAAGSGGGTQTPISANSVLSPGYALSSDVDYNSLFNVHATGVLDPSTGNASFQTSLVPAGSIIFFPENRCFPPGPIIIQFTTGSPGPTFPYPPCGDLLISTSPVGLNLSSSVSTASGGNWLTASLTSANSPATLTISANGAGLQPGSYTGNVTISAPQSTASPVVVPVNLTVTAPVSVGTTDTQVITQTISTGTSCTVITTANSLNPATNAITNTQTTVATNSCNVPSGTYNLVGGGRIGCGCYRA